MSSAGGAFSHPSHLRISKRAKNDSPRLSGHQRRFFPRFGSETGRARSSLWEAPATSTILSNATRDAGVT